MLTASQYYSRLPTSRLATVLCLTQDEVRGRVGEGVERRNATAALCVMHDDVRAAWSGVRGRRGHVTHIGVERGG